MSGSQIDCNLGTVKSRLFRGRRLLQRKLANFAVEMGYLKESVVRAVVAPTVTVVVGQDV